MTPDQLAHAERLLQAADHTPMSLAAWQAHARTFLPELIAAYRAQVVEVARLQARWEAIKPSGGLKAALSGEFAVDCYESTGNQPHDIPWTTVKDILAKARAFAEAQR